MKLDGQVVLVTGGCGGAGLGIAAAFQDAGAHVVACDVSEAAVEGARAQGLSALRANVALEADVDALFRYAEQQFGSIGVLINNVGISGPTADVEAVTLEDWNQTLATNLTSHFLCIRRAVPAMKKAGSGVIVNISSGSAKVGLPMRAPYVVSKAAVLSLTTTLARELGPQGIRANAILPGAIRGDRIKRVIRDKAAKLNIPENEYEASLLRYTSLRTMVDPQDIAAMAMFLASPAARYITGQCIGVDGNIEWEE